MQPDFSRRLNDGNGAPAPRPVVRCQQCQLMQFHPRTDLCRRCQKPVCVIAALPAIREKAEDLLPTRPPTPEQRAANRATLKRSLAIGTRLRAYRMQRGWAQVAVAEMTHLPRTYISRMENGHSVPSPATLIKIAEALQIDVCTLLPSKAVQGTNPVLPPLLAAFVQLQPHQMAMIVSRTRRMITGSMRQSPKPHPANARNFMQSIAC